MTTSFTGSFQKIDRPSKFFICRAFQWTLVYKIYICGFFFFFNYLILLFRAESVSYLTIDFTIIIFMTSCFFLTFFFFLLTHFGSLNIRGQRKIKKFLASPLYCFFFRTRPMIDKLILSSNY